MSPPERRALILLVVVLNVVAFGPAVTWDFTDADAWADVAWARRPLAEQLLVKLTGGVAGDDANFWRPAAMVQFWVERKLFGWNPVGWHVWDIAEHTLATLLGAAFVARSARFAGVPHRALTVIVAVVFAVHPLTEDVVPAIARSIDLLLGVGVFGALLALTWQQAGGRGGWALFLGAVALALGVKESAVLLLPLTVAWIALFRTDLAPAARAREAARVGAPVAALIVLYLGLRHHVLGGLGGYWDNVRVEWIEASLARAFVEPFVPSVSTWLPEQALYVVPVVWAVVLGAAWRSRFRQLAVFGAIWFVGSVILYAVTGTSSRRVYYVPTLAGTLVVATALVHAWRHPLGVILGLAWAGTLLHGTPLIVHYGQWKEIAAASELYRDRAFWARLPPGAQVWLAERPFRGDLDRRTFRLWSRGRSLHHGAPAYALQAWLDEVLPDRRIVLSTLTGVALRTPVVDQGVIVDVDGVSLVVRHDGADRQDWELKSPFLVEDQGRSVRITPKRARPGLFVVVWTPTGLVAWAPGSRELTK